MQAYRTIERNIKNLGFVRGLNDDDRPQHHSWRRPVDGGITVVLDFLCDVEDDDRRTPVAVPRGGNLSALPIPGANLAQLDYQTVTITAEALDDRGVLSEEVRVANIVPFVVLKAIAYEERWEQKDAYDLVYCLQYYGDGPEQIAEEFLERYLRFTDHRHHMDRALGVLRHSFAEDEHTPGTRKTGPRDYAAFLADPGREHQNRRHVADAVAVVRLFLARYNRG